MAYSQGAILIVWQALVNFTSGFINLLRKIKMDLNVQPTPALEEFTHLGFGRGGHSFNYDSRHGLSVPPS
jgi:hypothetical protein